MRAISHFFGLCFHGLFLVSIPAMAASQPLERLTLPPGFAVEHWADVDNPRQMVLGRADEHGGTVFVGSMRAGSVHAVRFDSEFKAQRVIRIASQLRMPVGVAYRDGDLYVSAISQILRFAAVEQQLDGMPKVAIVSDLVTELVTDALPRDTHHGWKFIAFGPDGKLYVPIGAPCNICEPDPNRYANIMRMNADGSELEVFANGVRNSVGFDWHPQSSEFWFTDNGRDLLGDDQPPDELNRAPRAGMHFGYPYCHGGDLPDPEFGARRDCQSFSGPAQKLGAHVASLGMRFYTGKMFPAQYHNQIFIAEHGSWNRSKKTGYRISLVQLKDNKAISYETFASGWLQGESVSGRPADLLVLPDGSLLVSDDYANAIYRIVYRGQAALNR